jgi:sec-independent protein translocase protein TatB
MFDSIGFQELILIGLIGLLVVGPKELPLLMRKAGQWMNKMRGMAADFRATFDEMARQAELDELRKEVEALRDSNPLKDIKDELSKPFDPGYDTGSDPFSPIPAEHPIMTPLVEPDVVAAEKPKKLRKPRTKKAVMDVTSEDVPA